jgi:hypothetical protein
MKMKELKLKIEGLAPILMHNPQTADPLNSYAKIIKTITSKRKKTDSDHALLSRIEWEASLYLENGEVVIPARCIDACLWSGAKKDKNGIKWQSGTYLDRDNYKLNYIGPKIKVKENGNIPNKELDKFYKKHIDRRFETVIKSKILRTRPIFYDWDFDIGINYNERIIEKREILQAAEKGGLECGLLDKRPRIGRFEIKEIK